MIRPALIVAIAALALQPAHAAAPDSLSPQQRADALRARMATWRGTWKLGPKTIDCKTTQSTGDARLDIIGCRAIQFCYGKQLPAISRVEQAPASTEDKRRKIAALFAEAKPCLMGSMNAAIDVLSGLRKLPPGLAPK